MLILSLVLILVAVVLLFRMLWKLSRTLSLFEARREGDYSALFLSLMPEGLLAIIMILMAIIIIATWA